MGKTSGKCFVRTNIVAAQCDKKILAPMTFYGSCNTSLFLAWVKQILVPELKAPGQMVVMDNTSFYKSPMVKDAIESVGAR